MDTCAVCEHKRETIRCGKPKIFCSLDKFDAPLNIKYFYECNTPKWCLIKNPCYSKKQKQP